MKSWVKALLISAVILITCIFYLPTLVKQGLNSLLPWAMEQAELDQVELNINHLSWHELNIQHLRFSAVAQDRQFSAQNLRINFTPWGLVAGKVKQASIEKAHLKIQPSKRIRSSKQMTTTNTDTSTNKREQESAAFILPSLADVFQQLPVDKVTIDDFKLSHPQGTVQTQLSLNKQRLTITNQIQSPQLTQALRHSLSINDQGEISSLIFIDQQTAPIFNLQANWSSPNQASDKIQFDLQQSADIQSWLTLFNRQQLAHKLDAKVAIQAWNLKLLLPKLVENPYQALSQLSAEGLWQVKIDDFNIYDFSKQEDIIEQADLAINLHTDIDHQRPEQWQFTLETFDLSGEINQLAPINLSVQQHLKKGIKLGCSFLTKNTECQWQGKLVQIVSADQLTHKTELNLAGQFKDHPLQGRNFNSQQTFSLTTQQENSLWPKLSNNSHGEIVLQGQQAENNWHWQLSLPYGINNKSQYLEPMLFGEGKKQTRAQLSEVHWQLLADWQIAGINAELTQAKAFSFAINQLKWRHKNQVVELDNAKASCNLDWLKLQYSPQLRSQQALSQLPLNCDWQLANKTSQWDKWPLPALMFKGELDLTSLDFSQAKLDARMKLTGLANSLDLTLLAQHDFNQLQKGSAQLYLNNLKLDWQQLGLAKMAQLTQAQLLAGSLSAQGWFQWQQYQPDIFDDSNIAWRWQPDLMLRIDDLAGIYQQQTTWEDIDIQLALRRPFYKDYRIDSQISALSINPGIEIANVLARSTTTIKEDLSQALVVIEEVHSDVLGGRINVPLIRFDTLEKVNSFGIEVEGLQVEQLAALEAGSGITATGKLDGVLPIILLPEGPQVPAGSLFARAPGGIVQYQGQTADSLKQSDPTVGLAMQVLEDFRYDKLQTNVIYQPNGELKLGLQFQGHNPTFFDGQATHFNLNLDYNLLDLLSSLRISNDIVQKLENKYQ